MKVAGGACARAVAQSTKQHVMIVDRHVVEFTLLNDTIGRSKYNISSALDLLIHSTLVHERYSQYSASPLFKTVAFVSSVDSIYKMRLRKEEQLIALFFKLGKNDPLILNCNECAIVSQQIRAGRGRGLVKKEAVNKALHLIQEIQAQERALEYQPSQQRVDEIFSLYDRAAEQFELAGEYSRQEEVEEHKMKFLAQPNVTSIMSGTPIEQANAEPKRGVEILETSVGGLGDDVILSDDEPQNWADFEHGGDEVSASKYDIVDESIDDMISETRQDFDAFNIGYEIDSEMNRDGAGSPVVGEGSAFAMQFEAAMTAAERELDEIRKM